MGGWLYSRLPRTTEFCPADGAATGGGNPLPWDRDQGDTAHTEGFGGIGCTRQATCHGLLMGSQALT
jgi:hypothetical protein